MTPAEHLKSAIAPLRKALATADAASLRATLTAAFAPDATLHLCHPFGDLTGPDALHDRALGPRGGTGGKDDLCRRLRGHPHHTVHRLGTGQHLV